MRRKMIYQLAAITWLVSSIAVHAQELTKLNVMTANDASKTFSAATATGRISND